MAVVPGQIAPIILYSPCRGYATPIRLPAMFVHPENSSAAARSLPNSDFSMRRKIPAVLLRRVRFRLFTIFSHCRVARRRVDNAAGR